MDRYRVNEIFYSLQGEGVRAGTPNLFLRFSRCNLECRVETHGFDCDTEFESGRSMTLPEIVAEMRSLSAECRWVILTGGEPALQVDLELIDNLHAEGYSLAIETNGSVELPSKGETIDWITVSPKVAEHAIRQRQAHEVKYVRGYGQGIPKTVVEAEHYLISPAFDGVEVDRRTLDWCIRLCRENPPWRLSVQQHKLWSVR
ncbi:MAG TPA: 7-carboxy-7-deazaguanine synthase QueE [Thermoanaerobaculia bacterium]|jgi:organic radical activating enzyme|nr:7-carboxy-7-deazaguanine synthase QueE [Thermoanaerobaculia bacterium]